MTDTSNAGVLLYSMSTSGSTAVSGSVIGSLQKIEPPAISPKMIDGRNHSSPKFPNPIFSGEIDIEPFSATFSFDKTALADQYTAALAGTTMNYKIAYPDGTNWFLSGKLSGWKVNGADANSPELMSVTVTISPSGAIVQA